MKKERRMFQGVKETLEKKIADLETKKQVAGGELHNATLYEKRQVHFYLFIFLFLSIF